MNLPSALTIEDFEKGQAEPPVVLRIFLKTLYSGSQRDLSEAIKRLVASTSQDILYSVTRGKLKPSKHLCMGVGFKSLTGS